MKCNTEAEPAPAGTEKTPDMREVTQKDLLIVTCKAWAQVLSFQIMVNLFSMNSKYTESYPNSFPVQVANFTQFVVHF